MGGFGGLVGGLDEVCRFREGREVSIGDRAGGYG